eukprot:scaffold130545_cov114-Phaeocystis_antarctica.AAC.4
MPRCTVNTPAAEPAAEASADKAPTPADEAAASCSPCCRRSRLGLAACFLLGLRVCGRPPLAGLGPPACCRLEVW